MLSGCQAGGSVLIWSLPFATWKGPVFWHIIWSLASSWMTLWIFLLGFRRRRWCLNWKGRISCWVWLLLSSFSLYCCWIKCDSQLNSPKYRSTLQMRINKDQVAKVVMNRIYCAAFHPSCSSLFMATGDTIGNVGLWGLVCLILLKGELLYLMNDIDLSQPQPSAEQRLSWWWHVAI